MVAWRKILLFYIGGCAYLALELMARGRTDSSMFIAGGLCFLLVGHLNDVQPRLQLIPRAILGAVIITMVEFWVGLAVNRDYHVWDYRREPGNFLGLICPKFTFLWIFVAWFAGWLYSILEKQITGRLSRPVEGQFRA